MNQFDGDPRWATQEQIDEIKRLTQAKHVSAPTADSFLKRTRYHELGDTPIGRGVAEQMINMLSRLPDLAELPVWDRDQLVKALKILAAGDRTLRARYGSTTQVDKARNWARRVAFTAR